MIPKYLLAFALPFLFYACGNPPEKQGGWKRLDMFRTVETGDSVLFKHPYRVRVCDSLLFLLDLHAPTGYFIQVFSYPGFDFVTSVCRKGKGAEEFITLSSFDVRNDSLYALEPHKKNLCSYSVKDLYHKKDNPATWVYRTDYAPILEYKKTPDGILFVQNGKNRKLIRLHDDGRTEESSLISPDSTGNVPVPYFVSLWNSFLAYDERTDTAVVVTQLGELLEIVRPGQSSKSIRGKGGAPAVFRNGNRFSLGKIDGYNDVKIYNHRIYALYSGADREEHAELLRKGTTVPDGADKLLVFGPRGALIEGFQLSHYVNGFDIDTAGKRLITVNSNTENPFVVYDLPFL